MDENIPQNASDPANPVVPVIDKSQSKEQRRLGEKTLKNEDNFSLAAPEKTLNLNVIQTKIVVLI
ncbi:hypothetical protein [Candidatus Liberibacter sp.]|uniref:hypothetical protein n=1 Tax=Candidatus Liberibacter sp. TaxID=34022 RepID=UPI0015F72E51|nr:hypothetical protein [Candidatus Liberibacter sp.]MBA5724492.1 hypothetical protein [Candidatus Liberibacter sp.]